MPARLRGRARPGYGLYLPTPPWHGELPLLVMLHGCKQDAKAFATGTGMNRLAELERFAVLYPEQDAKLNSMRCWNWFRPDVIRGEGEAEALVALIRRIRDGYGLDPQRVYIAGMSAGAAMAQVLAVRYPKIFAAAALHSGLMFHAAATPWQAMGAMRRGSWYTPLFGTKADRSRPEQIRWVPTLLIHGQKDDVVSPRNAEQLAEQVCALAKSQDGSGDESTQQHGAERTDHSMVEGGRTCQVQDWRIDGQLIVRLCLIEQLGHAWSGGDPTLEFNDAAGPDATRMIWAFLEPFRRPAPA